MPKLTVENADEVGAILRLLDCRFHGTRRVRSGFDPYREYAASTSAGVAQYVLIMIESI